MNSNIVELEYLEEKLNFGKQLGTSFSFKIGDEIFWSSVGIQKWEDLFRVYFNEVAESTMTMDVYQKEVVADFTKLRDALRFIELNTQTNIAELKPVKGQKIFNAQAYNF